MSGPVRARTVPVPAGRPSFLDVPRCESLDTHDADVAIVAFPYTVPYTIDWSRQPSSRLTLNLLGAMAHGGQIGSDTTRWT